MSTIRPLVGSGQQSMFGAAAGVPATRPTRARANHPANTPPPAEPKPRRRGDRLTRTTANGAPIVSLDEARNRRTRKNGGAT